MGPLVRGDSPPSRTATAAFIQRLQSWVDRGFCLHGSGAGDLTLIEPRRASDLSGNPARSLLAVYAHRDDVRIPVVKASAGPADPTRPWSLQYATDEAGGLTVRGDNLGFGSGYLYVLPADAFRRVGREFVAFQSVVPVAVETIPEGAVWTLPFTTVAVAGPARL